MQTEEEDLLVKREIGDAVLSVLEQGKVVSVENIITYLEKQYHEATHLPVSYTHLTLPTTPYV